MLVVRAQQEGTAGLDVLRGTAEAAQRGVPEVVGARQLRRLTGNAAPITCTDVQSVTSAGRIAWGSGETAVIVQPMHRREDDVDEVARQVNSHLRSADGSPGGVQRVQWVPVQLLLEDDFCRGQLAPAAVEVLGWPAVQDLLRGDWWLG